MTENFESLRIGAGASPIIVSLTDAAMQLLRELPGGAAGLPLTDHRSILTTIVVARAAGGMLDYDAILIDDADIRSVLDHAGMSRP